MSEESQNNKLAAPYMTAMLKATEYKAEILRLATEAISPNVDRNKIYDDLLTAREELTKSIDMCERSIMLNMARDEAGRNITLPEFEEWSKSQSMRRRKRVPAFFRPFRFPQL